MRDRYKKGFTLIEIALGMVLISILIAITIPLVANVVSRADLNSAHESLYNALFRAQQLSKNQYKNSKWRVCLDNVSKTYTITSGTCSSPSNSETIQIPSNITISSDQQLDIAFKLLNGELDYDNNFIRIKLSSGGVSKYIIVNEFGVIDKDPQDDLEFKEVNVPIVTNGLVLNLDAGNIGSYPGSGNAWTDLSPSFMSAELMFNPIYNQSDPKSFSFNGSNTVARLENNTNLDTQNPTVEVWIKTNNNSQNGFWFEKGTVNTQYSLFQEGGSIIWRQRLTTGITDLSFASTRFISTSNWYQIVGTFTSGDRKLYLNGVELRSDTQTGIIETNTGGMSIGAYGGFSGSRGYYYNGSIAIVRVYNRALSATEVQQNFNSNKARFGL
jgi:prepilin-type N-terminal cleavage/methylation domain-containing protein